MERFLSVGYYVFFQYSTHKTHPPVWGFFFYRSLSFFHAPDPIIHLIFCRVKRTIQKISIIHDFYLDISNFIYDSFHLPLASAYDMIIPTF